MEKAIEELTHWTNAGVVPLLILNPSAAGTPLNLTHQLEMYTRNLIKIRL